MLISPKVYRSSLKAFKKKESLFSYLGLVYLSQYFEGSTIIRIIQTNPFKYYNIIGNINRSGILGEGNVKGLNPKFGVKNKQKMLDEYVELAKRVADERNVTYINVREAFIKALSKRHDKNSKGFITIDGEHPNERGTQIMVQLFCSALRTYFKHHPKKVDKKKKGDRCI